MAYYWTEAERCVKVIDAELYAMWVATGNPKASYYAPIDPPPSPAHYYNGTAWVSFEAQA